MKINKLLDTKLKMNIRKIKTNSKDIKKGDVFVCALGLHNKNKYIKDAIKRGCKLVITNEDIKENIPYIKVIDTNKTLVSMLNKYYNNPLSKINLIGITGTDGKTTTTSILKDMLDGTSIGTNGFILKNRVYPLHNTTPSLDKIYDCLNKSIKKKYKNVIMEVSSESYLTKRIPNLKFDIGVFLNISKEHLDKHPNFQNYLDCKKELLKNSKLVILNHDCPLFKELKKVNSNYLTFGKKNSDLTIRRIKVFIDKTIINFRYKKKNYKVESPLLGKFNAYNLMSAILVMLSMNYDIKDIIEKVKKIKPIPGRIELLKKDNKLILIDYAHTINATLNILRFVHRYHKNNIITVIGCAGGRYQEKRKIIGKYALKYSKLVLFTSDDPRDEDPLKIIEEMIGNSHYQNYYQIINRSEAINLALHLANKDDLVLILGKGRDNYMAIGNEYIKYSDIDVIKKFR